MNTLDLVALLANYGITEGAQHNQGDVDGDGDVDLEDVAGVLSMYGMVCD